MSARRRHRAPSGVHRLSIRHLVVTIAVMAGVLAGAPSALAAPTITLVADCHNPGYAHAFDASVSGFPPDLPFNAVLYYSGVEHSFNGLTTDADGAFGPETFGADSPLGVVRAKVTATIDGATRTFTASLASPCDPQPTLANAMCADGNYRTYGFVQVGQCDEYVMRLQEGRTVPSLSLSPVCGEPAGSSGFSLLVLGFPPGTPIEFSLTYGGQSLRIELASDRFGAVGPAGFTLPTPLGEVTATATGGGRTLTATLHNPCAH